MIHDEISKRQKAKLDSWAVQTACLVATILMLAYMFITCFEP